MGRRCAQSRSCSSGAELLLNIIFHSARRTGFAIWFCLLCVALTNAAEAEDILIRAGHLVDPVNGSVTHQQSILIHDGKISSVGRNVNASAGAQVVDLNNEWVLPGLGDAHQHLTLDQPPVPSNGSVWEAVRLTQSTAERTLRGLRNAQAMLAAGFTMV